MARHFNNGENFLTGTPPLTDMPMTLACWAKPESSKNQNLILIHDKDNPTTAAFASTLRDPGDTDLLSYIDDGGFTVQDTGAYNTTGIWQHFCVTISSSQLYAYLDGTQSGPTAHTRTPTGIDEIKIGRLLNGALTWPSVWDVALTASEVAGLAAGEKPTDVRSDHLLAFWPMNTSSWDSEIDIINGYELVRTGDVSFEGNPGFLYLPSYSNYHRTIIDFGVVGFRSKRRELIDGLVGDQGTMDAARSTIKTTDVTKAGPHEARIAFPNLVYDNSANETVTHTGVPPGMVEGTGGD